MSNKDSNQTTNDTSLIKTGDINAPIIAKGDIPDVFQILLEKLIENPISKITQATLAILKLVIPDPILLKYQQQKLQKADINYKELAIRDGLLSLNTQGDIVYNPLSFLRESKELDETQNILSILQKAVTITQQKDDVIPKIAISKTWFNRWRNEAQFISEPEIQDIWGQILVGALYEPSDFSLKSLDILRYLTTEVSNIFSDLCQYVIDDIAVINLTSRQIEERKTDILEEYGLIRFNTVADYSGTNMFPLKLAKYQNPHEKICIPYRDHFIQYNRIGEPATLWGYQLTAAGRDFYKIAIQNEQYREKDNEIRTREFISFLSGIHDFKVNMQVSLYRATDNEPEFIEEITLH